MKIKPEMLEILHFDIENPMSEEVLDYFYSREVLIFLWKIAENETKEPEEILTHFVKTITNPLPVLDDHGDPKPGKFRQPLLQGIDVVPGEEDLDSAKDRKFSIHNQPPPKQQKQKKPIKVDDGVPKIRIPPAWTPMNKEATAAFIYIFFRHVRALVNYRKFDILKDFLYRIWTISFHLIQCRVAFNFSNSFESLSILFSSSTAFVFRFRCLQTQQCPRDMQRSLL